MNMSSPHYGLRALALLIIGCTITARAFSASANGEVVLSPGSVTASGIVVTALAPAQYSPQVQGVATVLDPQPLLVLAAQLQSTHATAVAAAAQAHATAAEAKRLRTLYRDADNAALRDVQTAEANAAAAYAQKVTADTAADAALAGARAQWGAALTALAQRGPQALRGYAESRAALLSVALPSEVTSPARVIHVQSNDKASATATLIGPSPRADAIVQGPTFFYRAEGAGLRSGQRLTVAVTVGTTVRRGIIVPVAAVLWYAGQPWAYLETAAGHYQRHPLAENARTPSGWFQSAGFRAGERVVVRGGELLLSQEQQPPPGAQPAGDGDSD